RSQPLLTLFPYTTLFRSFTEVAKGFWMRRDDIDLDRLVDYALRLDVGAVIQRLGFLLETFEEQEPERLERLRQRIPASYAPVDPDRKSTRLNSSHVKISY